MRPTYVRQQECGADVARRQSEALPDPVKRHLADLTELLTEATTSDSVDPVEVIRQAATAAEDAARAAVRANRSQQSVLASVTLPEAIARNVRECRVLSGWSQERVAEAMARLGYPWKRITVAEVEGGSRRVGLEELLGIAILFSVPVVDLLRLKFNEELVIAGVSTPLSAVEVGQVITGPADRPDFDGSAWVLPRLLATLNLEADDWRPAKAYWRRTLERRQFEMETLQRFAPEPSEED